MPQVQTPRWRHQDISVNGVRLHVVTAGPESGDLLIFLHGFPEFWYGWRHQIDYFAKLGYHVIVPDQRGYNESEKPEKVSDYSLDVLAQDVIGLIDFFKKDKATIVGHDWGAAVSWWLANAFPDRLKKLVILNVPHHAVFKKFLQTRFQQFKRSWYMLFFQLPFFPEKLIAKSAAQSLKQTSLPDTFSDSELEYYESAWKQPGALTGMLNWYRAAFRHPPKKVPSDCITVPTLLIWGKKDPFLLSDMAQPSIDLCANGKLVFFEEATHWILHEIPDQINPVIKDFIST